MFDFFNTLVVFFGVLVDLIFFGDLDDDFGDFDDFEDFFTVHDFLVDFFDFGLLLDLDFTEVSVDTDFVKVLLPFKPVEGTRDDFVDFLLFLFFLSFLLFLFFLIFLLFFFSTCTFGVFGALVDLLFFGPLVDFNTFADFLDFFRNRIPLLVFGFFSSFARFFTLGALVDFNDLTFVFFNFFGFFVDLIFFFGALDSFRLGLFNFFLPFFNLLVVRRRLLGIIIFELPISRPFTPDREVNAVVTNKVRKRERRFMTFIFGYSTTIIRIKDKVSYELDDTL